MAGNARVTTITTIKLVTITMMNVAMLAQQMQAKRDAAEAAAAAAAEAEKNVVVDDDDDDDDDDEDVFDGGGQGGCGEAGLPAAVRSSPSGDSFANLATENHLDNLDKSLVGRSRLELSGLQDRLSVASVHSPTDYVALPTVRLFAVFYMLHRASTSVDMSAYRIHGVAIIYF